MEKHKYKPGRKKRFSWRKLVVRLIIIFIFLQVLIFIFRNPIANYFVHQKAVQFGVKHQAEVHIGKLHFRGLSGVQVDDVFIKAHGKDTLLKVETTYVRLSFWHMLLFNVNLVDFKLHNTELNIVRDSLGDNYSNFLNNQSEVVENTTPTSNYAEKASDLLGVLFDLLPSDITITNFTIKSDLKGYRLAFFLEKFEVIEHRFSTMIAVSEENILRNWKIEGLLNPSENEIEGKWFSVDTSKVRLPYLMHKFETLVAFDTVHFKFIEENVSSTLTKLNGEASVKGLVINNRRISLEDVVLNNGELDYTINIGENLIELDSSSSITFNQMKFNPYIGYSNRPNKVFKLSINKPWFEAKDLFSSLPIGLFDNLKGIKVSGQLAYHLNLKIDFDNFEDLVFDSELRRNNFKIIEYGATDFRKINGPFIYTAFEKGEAVRSFEVGPENPNYRPFAQIPNHLVNCLLYSEDLGFFYHNGFYASAFRSAIITNLKANRFVRGGSTISMQLVKNVFLNRNKTISRKVEEALIVWLIESNRLSSKQRMMEVYLNIIEWGPGIYGANEAANFYFNKDISQINFAEAIFMASIVPKPKWFKSSFDSQGNLKPYLENYYKNISGRMLKNGIISQQEYDNLKAQVDLQGRARNYILNTDSILGDSLSVE